MGMKPYTKQYLDFQSRKYCRCGENAIVLGAFNSNARWGGTYSAGAYGTFTAALAGKKLVSAYHHTRHMAHTEQSATPPSTSIGRGSGPTT